MVRWSEAVATRTATLSDCEEVVLLLRHLGLDVETQPDIARQTWQWLWVDNPAAAKAGLQTPVGWVVEAGGRIVGFWGNIPRRYWFNGRTLLVGTGTSVAIEPAFRARVRQLAAAYFAQEGVDLLMGTTANRSIGRIFAKFSASEMPQSEYSTVLYWVLDGPRFLRASLHKKGVRPPFARGGALALTPALASAVALQSSRLRRHRREMEVETVDLEAVGSEFDSLWHRKLHEAPRLYAYRTAEDLRWHFRPRAEAGTLTILTCRGGGRLEGYLVLVRSEAPDLGLVRARVVDLFVAGDAADTINALVAGAWEVGRQQGCHVLELLGFPPEIRRHLARSRPLSRALPTNPFWYKAVIPALTARLREPPAWYPSPYDGDTTLV